MSENIGPIRFCTSAYRPRPRLHFSCCDCVYKKIDLKQYRRPPTFPDIIGVTLRLYSPETFPPQARSCVELNSRSRPFVGPTQRRPVAPFVPSQRNCGRASLPSSSDSNDFAQTAPAITPHTAPVPITSTSPKARLQSTRCPTVHSPGTCPAVSSTRHSARSAVLAD
jgi:hypothetical protein